MVEGQWRDAVEGKPLGLGRIVGGLRLLERHQGIVGYGDDPSARVALGTAEGVELVHTDARQPRFFLQFAQGTLLGRFIHVEESAGKGPMAFEGVVGAFDEQQFQAFGIEAENHAVRCHAGARIAVVVGEWIGHGW